MEFLDNIASDFYKEPTFLDAESVVRWKRGKGSYNFEELPETAIMVLNKKTVKSFSKFFGKKLKGLKGTNFTVSPAVVLCSDFGSGAPAFLVFMEELRVLGVKRFLFLGVAGIIDPRVVEQQAFLVSKAYSTVGSSFFYSEKKILEPLDSAWYTSIKKALDIDEGVGWSTDCPFRETRSMIIGFRKKSVQLVDMECAAIYAFSEFHNLPSICILIAADSLIKEHWLPPNRMDLIEATQKKLLSRLITMKILGE